MIPLQTGTPTEQGVYAARIDTGHGKLFAEDRMLLWMDGMWWYTGSDQRCRYEVLAWIGPLQRSIP